MIYIKENNVEPHSVIIQADGILDQEAVPLLKKVFERHLHGKKIVSLRMQGLVHISREGMAFLQEFKDKIRFIDPDRFLNNYFR